MPRLEPYKSSVRNNTDISVRATGADFGSTIGGAIQQAAGDVREVHEMTQRREREQDALFNQQQQKLAKLQRTKEMVGVQKLLSDASLSLTQYHKQVTSSPEFKDTFGASAKGYADSFLQYVDEFSVETIGKVAEHLKLDVAEGLTKIRQRLGNEAIDFEAATSAAFIANSVRKTVSNLSAIVYDNPALEGESIATIKGLGASVDGLTPEARAAFVFESSKALRISRIQGEIAIDAEKAVERLENGDYTSDTEGLLTHKDVRSLIKQGNVQIKREAKEFKDFVKQRQDSAIDGYVDQMYPEEGAETKPFNITTLMNDERIEWNKRKALLSLYEKSLKETSQSGNGVGYNSLFIDTQTGDVTKSDLRDALVDGAIDVKEYRSLLKEVNGPIHKTISAYVKSAESLIKGQRVKSRGGEFLMSAFTQEVQRISELAGKKGSEYENMTPDSMFKIEGEHYNAVGRALILQYTDASNRTKYAQGAGDIMGAVPKKFTISSTGTQFSADQINKIKAMKAALDKKKKEE